MARRLNQRDIHALINLIGREVTGQDNAIQVIDSSTFVSAGETIMAYGTENVLNAIGMVAGRLIVANRPRQGRFTTVRAIDSGAYSNRIRKISFYTTEAVAAGWGNTDLYTNLADGYTNGDNSNASTKSMWEQHPPVPLQVNFAGSSIWQFPYTVYEDQLKEAFTGEDEFARFWAGAMVEVGNALERQKEAFTRMTVLSRIVGQAAIGGDGAVDLVAAYNTRFRTSYTGAQLRTTYLKEFLAFFVATVKTYSALMAEESVKFHTAPARQGHVLLRQTPREMQKLLLYGPLFRDAESMVMPEIFHDGLLRQENGERVEFWQNINDPASVKGITAIPNWTTGEQEATEETTLPYVVGLLYDEEAMMVDFQFDHAYSTPLEARKGYRTVWHTMRRNAINDYTENAVLFYMAS